MIVTRLKRLFGSGDGRSSYLGHALGEMFLLVAGILIALQIDSWNEQREQRESLDRYLRTIATNVADDMADLEAISAWRHSTLDAVRLGFHLIFGLPQLTVEEVLFSNRALSQALELRHFSAKTSSFTALQRSSAFELMQGRDIEGLLHDYYDTVAEIAYREGNHNDFLKMIGLQLVERWPEDLEQWHVHDPASLAAERFSTLQPSMLELFHGPSARALYDRVMWSYALLQDYHRLSRQGAALLALIESGRMDFDAPSREILNGIFEPESGVGHPVIIEAGQVASFAYDFFISDSYLADLKGATVLERDATWQRRVFRLGRFGRTDDQLDIRYPGGADWAGFWISVRGLSESESRPSLDFSGYDTLQLEIRGHAEGQVILLNIEDATDAQDGSSTRYPLAISEQWQTYEIDLAEFETADMSRVWTPLGFVFIGDEPRSFSVRSVRYLRSGDR